MPGPMSTNAALESGSDQASGLEQVGCPSDPKLLDRVTASEQFRSEVPCARLTEIDPNDDSLPVLVATRTASLNTQRRTSPLNPSS